MGRAGCAFGVCITVSVLGSMTCPTWAQCREIWVDQAAGVNDPNTPGDPNTPFKSITYALIVAGNNGWPEPWCVYIRPGVYSADPNLPYEEREYFPINLRSEMVFEGTDRDTCIIDGQHVTEGLAPLLKGDDLVGLQIRGLTLRNMNHSQGYGGAIELINCSGSLENCALSNCRAKRGGGMDLTARSNSSEGFTFLACSFYGNTATQETGGGLRVSSPGLVGNLTDCAFIGNAVTANTWGGGLGINGSLTGDISGCTFTGNTCGRDGGGGFASSKCKRQCPRCTFSKQRKLNKWRVGHVRRWFHSQRIRDG